MKKTNNLLLEVHILQNFAPANLNRDDANQPKDTDFGGYRRARISSQCIKRSIRKSEAFEKRVENVGMRTKNTKESLVNIFKEYSLTDIEAADYTEKILTYITGGYAAKKTAKKKGEDMPDPIAKDKTKVLFYTHETELRKIADCVVQKHSEGNKNPAEEGYKEFLKTNSNRIDTVDIALFGRMLASEPNMKIDAAAQVAHAISTNKLDSDFDFFTAVDDFNAADAEKTEEDMGAGMMGDIGFNSSCFYRYALIDINKLIANLNNKKEMAVSGVLGFIEGAVEAIPTGKQTSFAAQNRPEFVMVTIRENSSPMNLANAFAQPVKVSGSGNDNLTAKSVQALIDYQTKLNIMYGSEGEYNFYSTIHNAEDKEIIPLSKLIENVNTKLNELLTASEA